MIALTEQSMKELTGAGTRQGMIDVLNKNGIPHIIKANGWPTTTAEAINGTLLGTVKQISKAVKPEQTPGFRLP